MCTCETHLSTQKWVSPLWMLLQDINTWSNSSMDTNLNKKYLGIQTQLEKFNREIN